MNRWLVSFVLAVGLGGCGADAPAACEDYAATAQLCAEAGGIDSGLNANYCDRVENLSGSAARTAVDTYECYSRVIRAGNCSSAEDARDTLASVGAACQ